MIMYAVVAFLVFFFIWKKAEKEFNTGPKNGFFPEDEKLADRPDIVMLIVLFSALWPISVPAKIAWSLMNKAYDKFDKPKTKQQ